MTDLETHKQLIGARGRIRRRPDSYGRHVIESRVARCEGRAVRSGEVNMPDAIRSHVLALSDLAKSAFAVMVGIPPLARRVRIPEMVGLLLFGVVLGPHVLELWHEPFP